MNWQKSFKATPPKYKPVAVVDIGSNSVRLVVYDGLRRSPSPIFNEKVLCGLGKGVANTGRLNENAVERALASLRRFKTLISQMRVGETFALATAAAREAENGPDFIKQAKRALGVDVRILTGKEEARFAALGVIASIPDADGIVGDLGGGSLELIDISKGKLNDGVTLPIGALRLIDMSGGDLRAAKKIVDDYLDQAKVLKLLEDRNFYAVGGTWRNLARLHMNQVDYPLHVLHNYTMSRQQAGKVTEDLTALAPAALKNVKDVSRSRVDTMPFGALVLERLLKKGKPQAVVSSVFGVREGMLFSKLTKDKQNADALLSSCWDFARRYARSPQHELELCDWTDKLFASAKLEESENDRRLRYAACLLADIGWRAHPDYRADRSMGMISQAAFVGLDHAERVFLAMTIFYRYEGEKRDDELVRLITPQHDARAHLLSDIFRLAYILSAAMPGMLPKIKLRAKGGELILTLPKKYADLGGERVDKRLSQLAAEMDLKPRCEIGS
jgi:exopolyphosphatase / guanosine-5'-triphosphate,3'-diphosphate pyrophosphatase